MLWQRCQWFHGLWAQQHAQLSLDTLVVIIRRSWPVASARVLKCPCLLMGMQQRTRRLETVLAVAAWARICL